MNRIDDIRVREQSATPGPWQVDTYESDNRVTISTVESEHRHIGNWAYIGDAQFIAHSRTDIPWLLGELGRLQKWVSDLQSGMYVNCVYCGHRYGLESETPASMADILKEHVEQCPEHPMSALRKENDRIAAENAALLVRAEKERDAAIFDASGYCETCAYVNDCAKHDNNDTTPAKWYYGDCEDWQWRGLQEDNTPISER